MSDPNAVGEPEADCDSVQVTNLQIGDHVVDVPISLSSESTVLEEVTRIFRMEELSLKPEQYTIVVTHINGDHVWLDHDITIDEALEDLTAPYHVEIAKFGESPRAVGLNMNQLNVRPKEVMQVPGDQNVENIGCDCDK